MFHVKRFGTIGAENLTGFVDEFETLNHWSVRTHAHRIDKKASYAKS